jgi:hypothetical protein
MTRINQDIEDPDPDLDELHYSYGREDCWRRALTRGTALPSAAARITKQTRMLANDVLVVNESIDPRRTRLLIHHTNTVRNSIAGQYSDWIEGSINDLA